MNDFSRRAQFYTHLDGTLAHHTRFFGAAALTNLVLAEVLSGCTVSQYTSQFLHHLSSYLESFNVDCARRIKSATAGFENLDIPPSGPIPPVISSSASRYAHFLTI